jgi:type IV pilus assembly protein PilB
MGVDRFERDKAQDGNMQRQVDGALIRFRVSVLPVANVDPDIRSESVVIRILDDRKVHADLTKLGLPEIAMKRFDKAIRQPFGMVLITGPTGSGKSTTLAAALQRVITPKVNVISIEDPIEYMIPGVQQIKLSDRLDMSRAMRAVLRHDPDIVMVGEIRDFETADLAIKLANTGHLTFSTLHTNDAPSAVSRLYKLGVEPFLLAYAINLVMAQRLVRVLCPECREVDEAPDESILGEIGLSLDQIPEHVYRKGTRKRCSTCRGTGYAGRRAIAEALYLSPAIRQLIFEAAESIDEATIKKLAIAEGMDTLQDAAADYVKRGLISTDEVLRVVATL